MICSYENRIYTAFLFVIPFFKKFMQKKTLLAFSIVTISFFILIISQNAYCETSSNQKPIIISVPKYNKTNDYLDIISEDEGPSQILRLFVREILFDVKPTYDDARQVISIHIEKKRGFEDLYNRINHVGQSHDTVFIYPSFTQAAYDTSGFYDYYKMKCDNKCLTVNIPDKIFGGASSSSFGAAVLHLLNFSYVKDQDVDKDPGILREYKRIIVLHNEYVTKREFDAINSHPNVIFLYPNALYAEVKSDYTNNTITLVRGHGYPFKSIRNGFDWNYDNSKYEYDKDCENWHFYKKGNFTMLNCYPEFTILYDMRLLDGLKRNDPTNLGYNISQWLMNKNENTTNGLLQSFDVKGRNLPTWVQRPAVMFLNGEISSDEFQNIIEYLEFKLYRL